MSNDPIRDGSGQRPRRSVLYVPAANQRAMAKIASLACDAVIFDLEDSVAPEEKACSREALRDFLAARSDDRKEIVVRINGLDSEWGTEDLLAARASGVDAILLPKVESPYHVLQAASALDETDAPAKMRLWAMVESPGGIARAHDIAATAKGGGRLAAFVVGPNDIAKDTGIAVAPGRPYLVPWLMQIVLAARHHGLNVLDGVYNDFRDGEGFAAECIQGRAMGFDGKTLIHPGQIDAANRHFGISEAAIEDAKKLIAVFDMPENAGKGVIQIDGRMVEHLHRDQAARLLKKARLENAPATATREGDGQ